MIKIERCFSGSKNEYRQQVWGLGIFPYRYLAVLKISRKSGADSCTSLVSSKTRYDPNMVELRPLKKVQRFAEKAWKWERLHKLIQSMISCRGRRGGGHGDL